MNSFQSYSQFLNYIESNYEEEEQLIIEDFMSYYINEYTGLGRHNCKYTYDEALKNDKTGELHKLSLIGFEFEKKRHDERQNLRNNKSKSKK
jgi:hypothetical protein